MTFAPPIPAKDPLYVLGKLREAVHALATGAGRAQERLGEAATYLIPIGHDELPDGELRRMLIAITDDLTFEQGEGGHPLATLKNLSDEDATVIAGRILEMYHRLESVHQG